MVNTVKNRYRNLIAAAMVAVVVVWAGPGLARNVIHQTLSPPDWMNASVTDVKEHIKGLKMELDASRQHQEATEKIYQDLMSGLQGDLEKNADSNSVVSKDNFESSLPSIKAILDHLKEAEAKRAAAISPVSSVVADFLSFLKVLVGAIVATSILICCIPGETVGSVRRAVWKAWNKPAESLREYLSMEETDAAIAALDVVTNECFQDMLVDLTEIKVELKNTKAELDATKARLSQLLNKKSKKNPSKVTPFGF